MMSAVLIFWIIGGAATGLVLLTVKLNKENSDFIDDLQFFLRQRIIAHNQVKAKLSVAKTKIAKLKIENIELKGKQIKEVEEIGFSGLLGEAEFVEVRKQKIQALEKEIDQLRNLQINDHAS